MPDDALIAWLNAGAPAPLSDDEKLAQLRAEFSLRFRLALEQQDLGVTQEAHEWGMACLIATIHAELNAHGEVAYSEVWRTLPAPSRRAIKEYVAMARRNLS